MKKLVTILSLFALVTALLPTASAAVLSGKWQFTFETEGGAREFTAALVSNGEAVSGQWNAKTEVKGTLVGDRLELDFPYDSPEAGLAANLKLSGVVNGNTISGNWQFDTYSGTFKAKVVEEASAASAGSLAGSWACKFEADRTHPFTLNLENSGDTWSGHVIGENGDKLPLHSAKLEADVLSFTVYLGNTPIELKATEKESKLDGTWVANNNAGKWTGSR